MPRPEGGGWWDAPWFMALNKAGVVVEVLQVARGALPGWLQKRLALQKQSAPRRSARVPRRPRRRQPARRAPGGAEARAARARRRALASKRCARRSPTWRASTPTPRRKRCSTGDTERYLRVLEGLRGEGEAPTYLLFTISSALFALSAPGGVGRARRCSARSPPRAAYSAKALGARDLARRHHRPRDQGRRQGRRAVGRVRQARPRAACLGTRRLAIRMPAMQVKTYMRELGRGARAAARELARADTAAKDRALARDGGADPLAARRRSWRRTPPTSGRRRRPAATPPSSTG